jgi:hypothetical protein
MKERRESKESNGALALWGAVEEKVDQTQKCGQPAGCPHSPLDKPTPHNPQLWLNLFIVAETLELGATVAGTYIIACDVEIPRSALKFELKL